MSSHSLATTYFSIYLFPVRLQNVWTTPCAEHRGLGKPDSFLFTVYHLARQKGRSKQEEATTCLGLLVFTEGALQARPSAGRQWCQVNEKHDFPTPEAYVPSVFSPEPPETLHA